MSGLRIGTDTGVGSGAGLEINQLCHDLLLVLGGIARIIHLNTSSL
jgi:hypothetical protein